MSDGGEAGAPANVSPYRGQLALNELMPSNHSVAEDEAGAYPDWLEIYNATTAEIDLGGFYLSDDPEDPTRAELAAGLVVPAGGVLLLWADKDLYQGSLHLPFALAAAGESLILSDPEQRLIDQIDFGAADVDTSYARHPDGSGAFSWCTSSTPLAINGDSCD